MKKIFLILFLGLIALICGPPQRLFASANSNATTTVAKKIYIKNTIAGAIASTITNQELSWTKTVAAEQPALPEYTGNKNFTLFIAGPANTPGTKIFYLNFKDPKTPVPLGLGRRLLMEA